MASHVMGMLSALSMLVSKVVLSTRTEPEDLMDEQEAYNRLSQAGFAEREIYYLLLLRRGYAAERAQREECARFRRLQFVRWLVRTGRLTEKIAREPVEEQEDSTHPA